MSFLAAGAIAAGTAAQVGGGIISRNEATKNAERQAAARNASLAKNVNILQGFGDQNRGTFDANMTGYAQPAQEQRLADAQTGRTDAITSNMTTPEVNAPIAADASPASRSDLAKRMLAAHEASTARAKSVGKLGGYGDAWLKNNLGNAQAGRDIGVVNNYAAGRKALIEPEAENAGAAAYKAPSIWGPLLQGGGSILSSAGGAGLGGGGAGGGFTGFSPDAGMYFGNGSQSSMGGGAGGGVWGK